MRRNKRLASMVAASALVATTVAMPVMAADGGEVDVDVTTRNAVIRVEVPTTLAIAVNQFEKGDSGSQIYSAPFGITNKSEIPVKLHVTSKATLDAADPINLVSSKDAAEQSTVESGEAWLAVAAMTEAGKYIEDGKTLKDLNEANDNVTTFVQGTETEKSTATAEQTFYLASDANPTVTYTKLAPTDADEVKEAQKISYAQFYEATAIATQPTSDDELQEAVDGANIYEIDSSDAVKFIEKGTAGVKFTAGATYYTVTATTTASKDLAAGKIYVYGEAGAAAQGGAAGFRYIGKLSEGKETWTNAEISNVNIKYDITGVTTTNYDEIKDECTYGLYAEGAKVSVDANGMITMSGLTAEQNYKSGTITLSTGTYNVTGSPVTWIGDGTTWSRTEGGTLQIQLGSKWVDALKGESATFTLTLSDGQTITAPIRIPA
jgi:hypothetical protein